MYLMYKLKDPDRFLFINKSHLIQNSPQKISFIRVSFNFPNFGIKLSRNRVKIIRHLTDSHLKKKGLFLQINPKN